MTKDDLIIKLLDLTEKNARAFNGLNNAIENLNDTNALHMQQTNMMKSDIENLVKGVDKFYSVFAKVFIIIIAAIVVLAGAEKVLRFM